MQEQHLAGLGGAAIKIGADFEEGMSEVQSISRASASDMELLKEKAKEMGAESKIQRNRVRSSV